MTDEREPADRETADQETADDQEPAADRLTDGEPAGQETADDQEPADDAGPSRRALLRATGYVCALHPATTLGAARAGGGTTTRSGDRTAPFRPGPTVGLEQVAGGPLVQPVGFAVAPGDGRRFVADQVGTVYVLEDDGLRPEPYLDASDRLVGLGPGFDERGLLGLAFHPEFPADRRLFVRYSAPLPGSEARLAGPLREAVPQSFDHLAVLASFRAGGDGDRADPGSERRLLEVPSPQPNHNAGDLAFGPDGYLYVPMGDGGGGGDVGLGHVADWYGASDGGNGQDVTRNLLGSVLRVDVDGDGGPTRPYAVPRDNPLVGTDALPEQYAWGFRNPWRVSFHGGTLVAADVGQYGFEEVDVVERGGNYGWSVREGSRCFDPDSPRQPPADCPDRAPGSGPHAGQPLLEPVVEYPHSLAGSPVGTAVVGGYVYAGEALPALRGRYVFGDWSRTASAPRGRLFVADPGGDLGGSGDQSTGNATTGNATAGARAGDARDGRGRWPVAELVVEGGEGGEINRFVQAFGRDAAGELYVLTSDTGTVSGSGAVYRLVPPREGEAILTPAATTTATNASATGADGTGSPGRFVPY